MEGCKEHREPAKEQQYGKQLFSNSGNPAVIEPSSLRPVVLRLRLLTDLPFSVSLSMAINSLMMQGHRLPKYSIDLMQSPSADEVFEIDVIELRVPCKMAFDLMRPPKFMIAKRPQIIGCKCRAGNRITLVFQTLMNFKYWDFFVFASVSVGD